MADYIIPNPLIDDRETKLLQSLTDQYVELTKPSRTAVWFKKIGEKIPESVKDVLKDFAGNATASKYYQEALQYVLKGFHLLESGAAKFTISRASVVKMLNKSNKERNISLYDEICLLRSYDIANAVGKEKITNRILAFIEGGGTGAAGFVGIPFNIALSTFIYYRAVQAIALMYGYDVKNIPEELIIASEVFTSSLSPAEDNASEIGGVIGKIMIFAESTSLRQAAKKGWAGMIAHGGPGLLIAQMRALANKAAQKALESAGKKGLEESVFKTIFEQIGKKLTLKVAQRSVPIVSGGIGALIDLALMNQVITFADIFYHKRFILEKKARIAQLSGNVDESEYVIVEGENDSDILAVRD